MHDANKCKVRFAKFADGERYPLLLDERGLPLWYPTLFTTTQFRNVSKAPNTMVAVLAALRVLMHWAQSSQIDLEHRFARRLFLNEQEMESLCSYLQTKDFENELQEKNIIRIKRRNEDSRGGIQLVESRVSSSTQYIRISYSAEYLKWLATRLVERDSGFVNTETLGQIQRMTGGLHMRRPLKTRNSTVNARKGLTENQQVMLLNLVERGSEMNPFSPKLQGRNQLIVSLLYYLGLRGGELLALRITDFDFQQNTMLVARRHDNPEDPRTYQPVAKTADRLIPLTESLVKLVSDYVFKERSCFPAAKQHDFLLVTHQGGSYQGHPLSIKALAKVFSEIQVAMPDISGSLTPHILRHTANDIFSDLMDSRKVNPAEEEKLRSYIMGWKEGSGTAATYTRRHTERKVKEAALLLQNHARKGDHG